VVTGALGNIGTIICPVLLRKYPVTCIDINQKSNKSVKRVNIAREYHKLYTLVKGHDVLIHLAWNVAEDYPNEHSVADNKVMLENIFRAAVAAGVRRVILASSVHADTYHLMREGEKTTSTIPIPDTPYGASKVYGERLGNYYAVHHNLEVVCIRFGGVNTTNEIRYNEDPLYDRVILYHQDCVSVILKAVQIKKIPGRFTTFYAVSNNPGRIHSVKNAIGWKPEYPQ
jgi:nucleoside-diphosphate-sugar epimerase